MGEREFDLLDEPWLPCRTLDGHAVSLGIRDTLLRAHELTELRDDSPLTTAALLRLLLAVLHAAHGRPWDNGRRAEVWNAGRWDAGTINGYLDQWQSRFDLFDFEHPFYQDGSFELPQPVTIARLAPQFASGNNATLFDHSVDAEPPAVSVPAVARWVVTYQAYTLGGGQGATSTRYGKHPNLRHATAAQGAVLLLRGENLFQTLLLNLVPYTEREPFFSSEDDRPLWERDEFPEPKEHPQPGYLTYLTWPIRCLRLWPEQTEEGWMVRRVDVAQGPYFAADSSVSDPFFARRVSAANQLVPLRLSAKRALWRDSGSLFGFSASKSPVKGGGEIAVVPQPRVLREAADLGFEVSASIPLSCVVVGMEFDQAKVNLWRAEELPVPWALLSNPDSEDHLREAVHKAESIGDTLQRSLRFLASALLKPADPPKADRNMAADLARSWGAEESYWPALEAPFRSLLIALTENPETASEQWLRTAIQAGNQAMDLAERQAGSGPREMHARVMARRYFTRLTWEWQQLVRANGPREEEINDAKS